METTFLPFVTEFFTKLGITTTNISLDVVGEDINIKVDTPDSALLIGMHGKNIEIFQHLLSRILEGKTKEFIHVHLEVNDYMKLKDEKLFRFLDSKIALIQTTGQSIRIPNLTSYERKKAHGYIADKHIIGCNTQSEGEGPERALIISYTGELTKKPITSTSSSLSHSEMTISDDGVGI